MQFHRLLARQLRRHFGGPESYPQELDPLVQAVNDAYFGFDSDKDMLERSLEISSTELLQANSELRAIFQAFPDLLFRVDADGRILDCRGGGAVDSYLPFGDLVGRRIQRIPIKEIADRFSEALARLQRTGNMVVTEYSLKRQGEEHFYEARFLPLPEGHTIVVIRTISDRKLAEEALQFAQFALDRAADIVFWLRPDAELFYANDAACAMLGCTRQTLLAEGLRRYDSSFSDGNWTERWERLKRDGHISFESALIARSGHEVPVDVSINHLEFRNSEYACVFMRDITERKRADDTLRRREERLNNQQAALAQLARNKALFRGGLALAAWEIVETTARTLDVASAGLWMLNDDRTALVASNIAEGSSHFQGMVLNASDAPAYFRALEHERIIAAHDAIHDHRTLEIAESYLIPNGIGAMLDVPVVVGGHTVGVISHEHKGPAREWTSDEQSFAASIADLVSMAIEVGERIKTEADLRIRTSAMNAAKDQMIIIDAEGRIEFVNPSFERETGYTLEEVEGQSAGLLASVDNPQELFTSVWEAIRKGEAWHGEIVPTRKDGSYVIEDVTITPIKNEHGVPERFIAIKRNITDKKAYEHQLDHLAHHDHLTGLPNRLLFSDRLTQRLTQASQCGATLAVLFLDLDRFKFINDSLGHNLGDSLLKTVSERLQDCLRGVDTIARMGGDEFTIIVSDVAGAEEVAGVAQRLVDALSAPVVLSGHEIFVTASVGISLYPADGFDVETLVKNADTAMYRAKEQGRNNYQFYTEALNAAAVEKMQLESSLRRALEREEFVLHYQPRVDTMTGQILGAEALLRWRHPENGLIYPGQFIPLAEETGLIIPISEWVMHTACAQNKLWQESGMEPISVAVNVSARHLRQEGLVHTVRQSLAETGLDPRFLELELTESMLMHSLDTAVGILNELKTMGLRLSIDDFGTGYSSLSYLKRLPIDAVKIDQSFIRDLTANPDDAAISQAVVAMAHSLKLTVIAEGVETLDQLRMLRSFGCDEMQGYFVSRPVPADQFETLLLDAAQEDQDDRAA